MALICFAILSSVSASWSWSRLHFHKLYGPVTGVCGEGAGCSWAKSQAESWAGSWACSWTGVLSSLLVGFVNCDGVLSGFCEGMMISKLFSFSQGGNSTTGSSGSLGLPIVLRIVSTLGVPCRCSPGGLGPQSLLLSPP